MTDSKQTEFDKQVSQKILASTQKPVIGEAGKTGEWRTMKPVLDSSKCIMVKTGKPVCFFCWLYCPEGMISKTIPPKIDYIYCKGCGICAHECPHKAITMIPEKEDSKNACEISDKNEEVKTPEAP
jgi:pyruvate ferredoxin oxidoreductase delta subunit